MRPTAVAKAAEAAAITPIQTSRYPATGCTSVLQITEAALSAASNITAVPWTRPRPAVIGADVVAAVVRASSTGQNATAPAATSASAATEAMRQAIGHANQLR